MKRKQINIEYIDLLLNDANELHDFVDGLKYISSEERKSISDSIFNIIGDYIDDFSSFYINQIYEKILSKFSLSSFLTESGNDNFMTILDYLDANDKDFSYAIMSDFNKKYENDISKTKLNVKEINYLFWITADYSELFDYSYIYQQVLTNSLDLFVLMQNDLFLKPITTFEKHLFFVKIDDNYLSLYIDEIVNDEELPKDGLDSLVKGFIMCHKLGITLPKLIVNYCVKRMINGKISFTNPDLVEASVVSLTQSLLTDNNIFMDVDMIDVVSFRKISGSNTATACATSSYIYYRKSIKNVQSVEELIKVLNTVFHEVTHAMYYNKVAHKDYNYLYYTIIRESKMNLGNKGYNYRTKRIEVDARLNSFVMLKDYLQSLGISPKQFSFWKELEENYKLDQRYLRIDSYYKELTNDKKIEYVPSSFAKIVDPLMIEAYPILALEYNLDGTKKNVCELFNELENYQKEDMEFSIIKGIINENNIDTPLELYNEIVKVSALKIRNKDVEQIRKAYMLKLRLILTIMKNELSVPTNTLFEREDREKILSLCQQSLLGKDNSNSKRLGYISLQFLSLIFLLLEIVFLFTKL